MNDLISRQAAIDAINGYCTSAPEYMQNWADKLIEAVKGDIAEIISKLPSAQEWIPITSRPMTEDERKEWSEMLDFNISDDEEAIIYCNLPDDGQSVLIFKEYSKTIDIDTFCDDDDGCYFEDNGDMDGITHWMPLPEPPENMATPQSFGQV